MHFRPISEAMSTVSPLLFDGQVVFYVSGPIYQKYIQSGAFKVYIQAIISENIRQIKKYVQKLCDNGEDIR